MKMFKKAAAFALAVTMLGTCLAGCGSSSESSGSGDGGNGSSSALKIGGIGPVTGAAAIYGQAVKNGAQIAVDEINEKGDLQLELKFEDDENDAEKSVNAYNKLKDWGMQVSLGSVTTQPCIAVSTEI
ncbi:MAG: ABC transporter substrate-binding protein, partial [Ruminococcus bromii]|nr:ABC transporter substrate-binding protein [Ruminococcus bromii]